MGSVGSMGVRGRLIAVTTLVLGLTVLASLLLSLRLEDWEARRAHTERAERIVEALTGPIGADLLKPQADLFRLRTLVSALERDREAFGLRSVLVLDKDGVDLGHNHRHDERAAPLDAWMLALVAGSGETVDPPPPAWPVRFAQPLFASGKRYLVVATIDEGPVNASLVEHSRRLGATSLVISLVGLLVLLLVLSWEVLRPLRQLAEMAEAFGHGKLRGRPAISGGRELQQLATALGDAAARLGQQKEHLEAEVARRTADLAAANIELSSMNERLQQLAITDPLTGLFNRRALEQALSLEVTRQKRGRRPFSLMMIDVDHFKKLNDTFGHAAGDEVLRGLARLVPQSLRASDIVARVGGEEFVVLLLDTELAQAAIAAEKVRVAMRGASFAGPGEQLLGRVTVSIGVASWPRHGESADAVLAAADRALYAAKDGGRDQARLAPEPTTTTSPEPQQPL